MKKEIRLWFADFWGLFNYHSNIFVYILEENYTVIVTSENPDIIITGGRKQHQYPNAIHVYYSAESHFDIGDNDFALTSYYVNDARFFRVPLCLLYLYDYFIYGLTNKYESLYDKEIETDLLKTKNKFCAYISQGFGHPNCIRERFFDKLIEYKQIDSAGKHRNNLPLVKGEAGTISGSLNKINFLRNYKFVMAFEGTDIDRTNGNSGWITEKIIEPMMAKSIPIYWGNALINKDLNPKSFINWHDYGNDEETIKRIIEVDNDDNLYMSYINEPFIINKNESVFKKEYLVSIFETILKKFNEK